MLVDLYATWLGDDFDVVRAECGAEALDRCSDVDVAFLDRHMPNVSGDEVLAELPAPSGPHVAFVSAATPDPGVVDSGVDAYLTKPVSRGDLLDAARALVVRRDFDEEVDRFFALLSCRDALRRETVAGSDAAIERLERELARLADRVEDDVRALGDDVARRALPPGVSLDFDIQPSTGVP